jgi:hypothetical protein
MQEPKGILTPFMEQACQAAGPPHEGGPDKGAGPRMAPFRPRQGGTQGEDGFFAQVYRPVTGLVQYAPMLPL